MFSRFARQMVLLAALALAAGPGAFAAAPVALFDQSHGQRFLIDDGAELGLKGLAGVFDGAGYSIRVTAGKRINRSSARTSPG